MRPAPSAAWIMVLMALASGHLAAVAGPPNIVVILCDDMGFSDLGCYGGEIPTPHLDGLAAKGVRFSQFYNTGRCCPTRASLLTGLTSHRAGVGHMVNDDGLPGYRGRLGNDCVTIAEALKPAGYFTAMSGKWHVGQNHGVAPWNRGFDRSLDAASGGFYQGGSKRYDLSLDGEPLAADDPRLGKDWFTTDVWTRFGLQFIDEAVAAKKPFFLYLAHNAPHFPLQARPEEIAGLRGRFQAGWDTIRDRRIQRQRGLGLIDARWQMPQRPGDVAAWETLPAEEQDRLDHLMAVYAATVQALDRSVGELVTGLEARGLLHDTVILFLSDNGGNAESGPLGKTEGDPTDSLSQWYCGEGWAFAENAPFRKYKHYCHEGGIATPLIAHWPAGIVPQADWIATPGHVIDIMPTCLELAGAAYPRERDGTSTIPLEGRSLVPAFRGQTIDRDALYWEHEGNAAVRVGDLKLVRIGDAGAWELYDLAADRTEQHDLAGSKPDMVATLAATWQAWAERTHVVPKPPSKRKKSKTESGAPGKSRIIDASGSPTP